MLSFSDWDALLATLECLGDAEEAFVDSYGELSDEDYELAIQGARDNQSAPLENFVKSLGVHSLYTKYQQLRNASLEPQGIDTFAYTLFNSRAVQAVLNDNFEVKVGGQVYDALNTAFGCSTRACAEGEILNMDYTFCTRVRKNRFQREITTDRLRRANVLSSHYPLGPVIMLTVNFDNEVKKNGKWKSAPKNNLQAGVEGQWRTPFACTPFAQFDHDTSPRFVKGIELRKVLAPELFGWSAPGEFGNTVTMFGDGGYQFTYTW